MLPPLRIPSDARRARAVREFPSDWFDPYPGAPEGHDDPDSVFYMGHDGPVEFEGRIYDDRNPYGISCYSASCQAAGDCYCDNSW